MNMNTTPNTQKKTDYNNITFFIILSIIGLFLFTLVCIQLGNIQLIPITALALVAGTIYENYRLTKSYTNLLMQTIGSFVLSFLAFLPGKGENTYNIENNLAIWPYVFVLIFILMSIAYLKKKITPKLTEGITLLQSFAIIYWVIDFGLLESKYTAIGIFMTICLLFALFSIYNAFTYKELSTRSRLILSIWSSIIMLVFAVDSIYQTHHFIQIESMGWFGNKLFEMLQFFLLGICSVYIAQNVAMLGGFIPEKGKFFNQAYFNDIKILKQEHINRYSNQQVSIIHSCFCLIVSVIVYGINYWLNLIPRNVAIWSLFVLFPFMVILFDFIRSKYSVQKTKEIN